MGVVLKSKQEEVAALMKGAGREAHQALLSAQRCARFKELQSVEDVVKAQATIAAALETAAKVPSVRCGRCSML